jgi:chemotaxis protein methyltransferase CheR
MLAPDARSEALPPAQLAEIARFVAVRLGLGFPTDRHEVLARGVRAAAAESGFADGTDYAAWLLGGSVAQRHLALLASHLTIGETYFFREPTSLEALRSRILPELVAARRLLPPGQRCLRIWSAGCASGEEPYSVAMLLELAFGDLDEWDVTILATDVNPRLLDHGRLGIYRDWSFRGMDDALKQRFFHRLADGRLEIAARLRRRISFAYLNLVEDAEQQSFANCGDMDVILCRNVAIYFEEMQGRTVARRLANALAPDGSLLTGTAEAALPYFTESDALDLVQPALYRKRMPLADGPSQPAPLPNRRSVKASPSPQAHPIAQRASGNKAFSKTVDKIYPMALARFREGNHEEAARLAEECLQRTPTEIAPMALLARIHADRGALAEAIEWSKRALAGNKTDAQTHYLHASILIELDRSTEAIKALHRALYLAPDFVPAHYGLGILASSNDNPTQARKHFDNALAILAERPSEEIVAEAEGLEVHELIEIIRTLRDSIPVGAMS